MLHEVLLALSGHPSSLFGDVEGYQQTQSVTVDFPLLSPSVKSLLESIGDLSLKHRKLREHLSHIAQGHASVVCRAVAISIVQVQLARFQQKILDVETSILTKDARVVGAYDIVPLATVVGEFDDWHRRMTWLWNISCYMQPVSESTQSSSCTGAALIDKLRDESHTGYPEIELAAVELSRVAETAWLKQLASWLLYGKLPSHGSADLFIHREKASEEDGTTFILQRELCPAFVTPATASSMLFIGKSIHQIKANGRQSTSPRKTSSGVSLEAAIVPSHVKYLSSLSLPIVPAQLARSVTAIRQSLSQNVLQHLLPTDLTICLLSCLRQYFLLGRGEFAVAMIDEAENRLQARRNSMGRHLQQDPIKALQGLSIKDAELQQALRQAWKSLEREEKELEDFVLDFAMKHISLSAQTIKPRISTGPSHDSLLDVPPISSIAFNDLMFPQATSLSLLIVAPLDLFISPRETEIYSNISSYLLAIRRSQVRLSSLWRRTTARRDHPSPSGRSGPSSATSTAQRTRIQKRTKETRKVWATCSAAIFLISEVAAYLEGEVIRDSCEHFEQWVRKPPAVRRESSVLYEVDNEQKTHHDPETLAAGHRFFLASLTYALLLTETPFTRELRSLLGNIDALVAFFFRLLDIQQKLDIENDEASGESAHTAEDERSTALELDRARKKVDSDLRSMVNCLRQLSHERIGSGRYLDLGPVESGGFEPWKGGGVDRLLMKLDFGRMTDADYDVM